MEDVRGKFGEGRINVRMPRGRRHLSSHPAARATVVTVQHESELVLMRDRPGIQIPDEGRKRAIASIRQYFDRELDEDIGDLKASLLLDYFLAEIGPSIYNSAIADAKAFFDERAADLAALCTRDEFTYWVETAKRRR